MTILPRIGVQLLVASVMSGLAGAQVTGPVGPVASPGIRAPYLTRGDLLEAKYGAYRKELEGFFRELRRRVEKAAPELLPKLEPPAAVPYGYQLLPRIVDDAPIATAKSRIRFSPFSWSRTDSLLVKDRRKLESLTPLVADARNGRAPDYAMLVGEYQKLVAGQKLIEAQIQYNRFWQGDVATHAWWYGKLKSLQAVALERERLNDSLSKVDGPLEARLRRRVDSLSRVLDDHLKKLPTPKFVRVEVAPQRWVLRVPVYTDIQDSAFVEAFRKAVEDGWHVRDGDDDFRVKLEMRRVSPSALYRDGRVPANGAHIDVDAHAKRFPTDGMILTTGANALRAIDRTILLSPHATKRSLLVHEFGHMLGFKDGYFRSYEDRGAEGYEIVEVILGPYDVLGAPESGVVRREHFKAVLRER
ncbi:MAG: hypothetical protein M3O61_07180 [Gemmatimonadota bacterium]|nr:hypothetical protein [Gemmatimonadota bacterium]